MIKNKKWVALFSHTGSEIVELTHKLSRPPDLVITNNSPDSKSVNSEITKHNLVYTDSKPTVESYRTLLEDADIVTLHGWMRIIPKEICREYNIYNLHPGLITKFPELKGADPQKRVAACTDDKYKRVGCVIHKVIPEVDEGEVIIEASTANNFYSEEAICCQLKKMALSLWLEILND